MQITFITLFPDNLKASLEYSMLFNAIKNGILKLNYIDLRQFGSGPRKQIDDKPYGGGPGMLLKPEPIFSAVEEALKLNPDTDVVMINNDIEAKEGWLKALCFGAYGYGKNPEKIGIVGAKLLYPDGTIQHAGAHRNSDPDFKFEFDHYYRFRPSDYGPANVP